MSEYRLVDLLREIGAIAMILRQEYPNNHEWIHQLVQVASCADSSDEDVFRETISYYQGEEIDNVLDAVVEYTSVLEQARGATTDWSQYDCQGPIS